MKIGYIGLGKMGYGMVENLLDHSHQVVAFNRSPEPTKELEQKGAMATFSIEELVGKLDGQKIIWLMVPWKAVDEVIAEVIPFLNEGDILIDGGNSPYIETIRRAKEITEKGIHFVDIGVSGGPSGARNGACMMIGGEQEDFDLLKDLVKDLCVENGFGYMGKHGAGHFVKMVHNGIEYGMMQAIGEGFEVMKKAPEFDVDLLEVTKVYNHGSVIESRLVAWLQKAFEQYGMGLDEISGEVGSLGEGLWTVEAAKRNNVPVPIIEGSLKFRENSHGNPSYTGQVVSALRNQFGGHDVSKNNE
ncbi:decarboxylating 6-phosphogluconate dehydrogenase [Candidatus Nomurabacteria bacterium]|nr:decarboxylating 6-phosphogluconate dehydrogenase [Candidatus Nomurabacteria bacterium]